MANQPDIIPSAWAANNSTTETIPATTTESGKASWDQGFPVETSLPLSQGGIPPKYGDFNGILNVLSQFCLFAQSGGQYAWVNSLDYSVGSIVLGTDGSIYRAAQVSGPSTAAVNPVGDTSGKWERIVSKSDIDALEEDIQNAMDAASDAASNASAAQSAVTTLDANVVKLSGAQTISGAKTFSDTMNINNGANFIGNLTASGTASINGVNTSHTAMLTLNGNSLNFGLYDSTNSKWIIKSDPSGNVSVDDKGVVYTNTNQQIDGEKTFTGTLHLTQSPEIKRGNPYLYFVETDVDITTNHGNTSYQGVHFCDKNGTTCASILTLVYGKNSVGMRLGLHSGNYLEIGENTESGGYVSFIPRQNGVWQLGDGNHRWKEIWCTQNSINSNSDERIKQQISSIPDNVLDAWGDVQWTQFKYNDACEEKGADKARLHNGLIAQRVGDAFKTHGLDASAYGLFLYDKWDAQPEEKDQDGNITQKAQPAGDAYGLRYTEALCMEAAYQRRRADRTEARIAALEQRLGELEAVLASLISPISEEQTEAQEGEGADA